MKQEDRLFIRYFFDIKIVYFKRGIWEAKLWKGDLCFKELTHRSIAELTRLIEDFINSKLWAFVINPGYGVFNNQQAAIKSLEVVKGLLGTGSIEAKMLHDKPLVLTSGTRTMYVSDIFDHQKVETYLFPDTCIIKSDYHQVICTSPNGADFNERMIHEFLEVENYARALEANKG